MGSDASPARVPAPAGRSPLDGGVGVPAPGVRAACCRNERGHRVRAHPSGREGNAIARPRFGLAARALFALLAAFAALLPLAVPARASCTVDSLNVSPPVAFADSHVVFRGRVTEIGLYQPLASYLPFVSGPATWTVQFVRFEVDRY